MSYFRCPALRVTVRSCVSTRGLTLPWPWCLSARSELSSINGPISKKNWAENTHGFRFVNIGHLSSDFLFYFQTKFFEVYWGMIKSFCRQHRLFFRIGLLLHVIRCIKTNRCLNSMILINFWPHIMTGMFNCWFLDIWESRICDGMF